MKGDLVKAERLEIAILRNKGYSMRSVGESMGRSPKHHLIRDKGKQCEWCIRST